MTLCVYVGVYVCVYTSNESKYLCPQKTFKRTFVTAVFVIAQTRNNPNVQQENAYIFSQLSSISNKNEQFTATHNMDESHKIIWNHRNYTPKNIYCMIPLISGSKNRQNKSTMIEIRKEVTFVGRQ